MASVGLSLKKYVPITGWFPQYTVRKFRGDVIAGLTVGLMVVPQGASQPSRHLPHSAARARGPHVSRTAPLPAAGHLAQGVRVYVPKHSVARVEVADGTPRCGDGQRAACRA